jgi:WD40 repeat protein
VPQTTPFPSHLVGTIVTDPFTKPDIENDPAYIFNVCVHGGLLAATSSTNVIKVYDLNTHALVAQCAGHKSTITDAYIAPTGALFTSSLDGYVRMWDLRSGKCEQAFDGSFLNFFLFHSAPSGLHIFP